MSSYHTGLSTCFYLIERKYRRYDSVLVLWVTSGSYTQTSPRWLCTDSPFPLLFRSLTKSITSRRSIVVEYTRLLRGRPGFDSRRWRQFVCPAPKSTFEARHLWLPLCNCVGVDQLTICPTPDTTGKLQSIASYAKFIS